MNERLTDLTPQEIWEAATTNPQTAKAIRDTVDADPRVRLFETLYKKPEFAAQIEEMGVAVAPDSNLARARRHARAEIADDVAAVKALRKELEDGKVQQQQSQFHDQVRESATALGYTMGEKDLAEIVTFMGENHYGPKAVKKAVEAFYETKEPAEPNFESEHTFQFEDEGSDYIKKLTEAPPFSDTSQLTLRHAEHVYRDMFGTGQPGARRPSMARG